MLPDVERLIASLDAQSLPSDELEIIFVDDGSTDGTHEWLCAMASSRPHVQVLRIPHSGWPGRPRNVGIAQASGEYVFFADHDDLLFPEALQRMHEFAVKHRLDVLLPKEVVKGWKRPFWDGWRADTPRVEEWTQSLLQCITPHKLYRRAFLQEQDLRFPEGDVRLEDFAFNALAWSRTDSVGVLAGYPCYQWKIHSDNSHKKEVDFDLYWDSFRASVQPVLEMPAGPKKDQMLLRWYRSRVLQRVRDLRRLARDDVDRLMRTWSDLLDLFPPHLDAGLDPADRPRSRLLRAGAVDELLELSELDRGVRLEVRRSRVSWSDGSLVLGVRARLVDGARSPVPIREEDGRLYREVPPSLEAQTTPADWDFTDALRGAAGEIVLRARRTGVDWIIPARTTVEVVDSASGPVARFDLRATIDPRTAALGGPLAGDVWDVFIRVPRLGFGDARRVTTSMRRPSGALIEGRTAVVYRTRTGKLALDLSGDLARFIAAAGARRSDVRSVRGGVELALPRLHAEGKADIPCELLVEGRPRQARLVARRGRATVTSRGPALPAAPVRLSMSGRTRTLLRPSHDGAPAAGRAKGRRARRAGRRWRRRNS